jgi:hypothetical protein
VRKGLLVVAGALVSALLFSGCFAMRTLKFTDDTVEAGKKTPAKISVVGDPGGIRLRGGGGPEYPFFYFISEQGSTLANGGKFDTKGVFDGPVDLKKNGDLAIAASEPCQGSLPFAAAKRGVPGPGNAVTTDNPFDAPNPKKFMNAKLPIKTAEFGPADGFGIFMGTWFDDGDGSPEDEGSSDDQYECQPPYTSFLKIKGGAPPPP